MFSVESKIARACMCACRCVRFSMFTAVHACYARPVRRGRIELQARAFHDKLRRGSSTARCREAGEVTLLFAFFRRRRKRHHFLRQMNSISTDDNALMYCLHAG